MCRTRVKNNAAVRIDSPQSPNALLRWRPITITPGRDSYNEIVRHLARNISRDSLLCVLCGFNINKKGQLSLTNPRDACETMLIRPPVRSNGRTYKMLVMFFFFFSTPNLRAPSADCLKLCHTIGIWFYFIMQVQKFGGSPKKKFGGQKHAKFRSILYHLTLWSRISQERLKISKIGKLIDREQFLPRSTKKVRWTLVYKWQRSIREYEPTKMHLFGRLHFGP